MGRKRLGELLLDQGRISQDQLDAALAYQRQSGNRIGMALIALKAITEDKLCETLSQALGLQVIQLDSVEVDWNALHALRDRFCEANDLFPVSLGEAKGGRKVLTVGMADLAQPPGDSRRSSSRPATRSFPDWRPSPRCGQPFARLSPSISANVR